MPLRDLDAWRRLAAHRDHVRTLQLRDLFRDDPHRFDALTFRLDDLLVDLSKHLVTRDTLPLLAGLARARGVEALRDRMFAGERINSTEDRAVLHVALRNRSDRPVLVDGRDVMPDVRRVLKQMRGFTNQVRSGKWTGYKGDAITDIVNIGIGGSDLGPVMV